MKILPYIAFVLAVALAAAAGAQQPDMMPRQLPPGCHGSVHSGQGFAPGGAIEIPTRWGSIKAPPGTPVWYRGGRLLRPPRVMVGDPVQRRGVLPWLLGG